MQAIMTRYLGCTNLKPARIRASCAAKAIILQLDYVLDVEQNHISAARILADRLGWGGDMVTGVHSGDYFHVFDDGRLSALRGMVNSIRNETWSGNPWFKPEFKAAALTIGRAYGWRGESATQAPTTDAEILKFKGQA